MRQIYHTIGHRCYDLTECKIHRIVAKDGKVRFIVSWPKKWEATEPQLMQTMTRGGVTMRGFDVTEWEEAELELKS